MKTKDILLISFAIIQTLAAVEPACKDITPQAIQLVLHIISITSSIAFPLFIVYYVFDIHNRIKKEKQRESEIARDHALRLSYIFDCMKHHKIDKIPRSQLIHLTDKDLQDIGFDLVRIAEANRNRHKGNEQEIFSLEDQMNPSIKT